MFSVPDILLVSVLALLLFGPEKLPSFMRQAGRVMREVQNTSQSFVAEMERAADVNELGGTALPEPDIAAPASTIPEAAVEPSEKTSLPPLDGETLWSAGAAAETPKY